MRFPFEVLNYSEYAPIAEKKTDSKGNRQTDNRTWESAYFLQECVLTASGSFTETVMNTEKEDNCELCLVSQDKEMTANQKSGQQQICFAPLMMHL